MLEECWAFDAESELHDSRIFAMGGIMSIMNDFTKYSSEVDKTISSLDLEIFEWCNIFFLWNLDLNTLEYQAHYL